MRVGDSPHKVIYLLHGTSGNSINWVHNTLVPIYAHQYNVAFVIPEVGNTWYRDIPYRGNYFSYIVDELPQIISGIFNISTRREDVAIMGNSMGAYGAIKCALSRPNQYWLGCGFSTACVYVREYLDELRANNGEDNPHLKSVYGNDLQCTDDDELIKLARRVSQEPTQPELQLTIGKNDFLYNPNLAFDNELKSLNLKYSFDTWEGEHDWVFWDQSIKFVLEKYYT